MRCYDDLEPEEVMAVREQYLGRDAPLRAQWDGWARYLGSPACCDVDWDDPRTVLLALWPTLASEECALHDLLDWPCRSTELSAHDRGCIAHAIVVYLSYMNDDMWWEIRLGLEVIDRLGGEAILNTVGNGAIYYFETKANLARSKRDG